MVYLETQVLGVESLIDCWINSISKVTILLLIICVIVKRKKMIYLSPSFSISKTLIFSRKCQL